MIWCDKFGVLLFWMGLRKLNILWIIGIYVDIICMLFKYIKIIIIMIINMYFVNFED